MKGTFVIVLCTIFLVSCIFFNKCLYFFIAHGWIFPGQTSYFDILQAKLIRFADRLNTECENRVKKINEVLI